MHQLPDAKELFEVVANEVLNPSSPLTQEFFAKVQNKLHYAIHGRTAAELIMDRADSARQHMGLSTWEKAPHGRILKTDVSIAKHYLNQEELQALGRVVNAYLDLAEDRARLRIPMTMEDWSKRLDTFLEFTERDVLRDAGRVSAEIAKIHAENEFEKYRKIQDQQYESDFDRLVGEESALEEIEQQLASKKGTEDGP